MPRLRELRLGVEPENWAAAGFAVGADGVCALGTIGLRLDAGHGDGILSWVLDGVPAEAIDGLVTEAAGEGTATGARVEHPNGVTGVDHVVVATPDLPRTLDALGRAGFALRRIREAGNGVGQGLFVVGDALLEVAGPAEPQPGTTGAPARFWGITLLAADLDATVAATGGLLGEPRDAVQPGRRIAIADRAAGLGTRVAVMSPRT